jgi:CheY-like chemotaxis protein
VQQILAFSRRDAQELKVLPLQPIVGETLAMLRAMLPSGVRLDRSVDDAPLQVRANATLLQQVLINIGTNAWHALPDGGGSIEIGLREAPIGDGAAAQLSALPRGRYAHLWIRDSGSGMDEATLARAFEPFFTTKPVGRGTGLGLSVAHGIVAAHGGAITLRSRLGAGTTVDLYLPLADDAPPVPAPAETVALPSGQGQHVVYIDDDEAMAPVAEGLLRSGGYRVTSYGDARAALRALRVATDDVDLVVTDYNMPELSGLHVARELARVRPRLPVVITSGFIDDELRRRAAEAGVRRLLNKEQTCEQLCAVVGAVLEQTAAAS